MRCDMRRRKETLIDLKRHSVDIMRSQREALADLKLCVVASLRRVFRKCQTSAQVPAARRDSLETSKDIASFEVVGHTRQSRRW